MTPHDYGLWFKNFPFTSLILNRPTVRYDTWQALYQGVVFCHMTIHEIQDSSWHLRIWGYSDINMQRANYADGQRIISSTREEAVDKAITYIESKIDGGPRREARHENRNH